jgi:hypothetical protein
MTISYDERRWYIDGAAPDKFRQMQERAGRGKLNTLVAEARWGSGH